MNFFQLQNKLFYSKKDKAGDLDAEGEQSFVPFLLIVGFLFIIMICLSLRMRH